jgi:hypothetical protein
MIRYSLSCHKGHSFEAWFAGSDAYEQQNEAGLIPCPVCGSTDISKALMTPSVSTSKRKQAQVQAPAPEQSGGQDHEQTHETGHEQGSAVPVASPQSLPPEALALMREIRDKVTANAEYVGTEFAEEARKIHYGEREKGGIYGEAGIEDVKSLHEEGIDVVPLPVLPEDRN